jgi:hypothetical protein
VSCTKVLTLMNSYGALFGNAGANAIGSFGLFGPHAAQPCSPMLELVGFCLIAAMIDCNTFVITQEDGVSCLPHNFIEALQLVLRIDDQLRKRLSQVL